MLLLDVKIVIIMNYAEHTIILLRDQFSYIIYSVNLQVFFM